MVEELKLMNADESRGDWIDEEDYLKICKIVYKRNTKLYDNLVAGYEYVLQKKFPHHKIDSSKNYKRHVRK